MPKVKDLGVTVVPEKGGVGRCTDDSNACSSCTNEMARLTIMPRPGAGCSDCTMVPFSICGTTPGPRPCTDCTMVPFSICGTSPQFCTDCTHVAFSICGTSPIGPACRFQTHNPWTPCGGTWQTPCGGSWGDPWGRPAGGGGLTQQSIDQLRQQLQAQLAQLDEVEKQLGPQTAEEIDAREKELNAELAKLKGARAKLKKK